MPESVELVELATGARVERHVVDARECIASGSYVLAADFTPVEDPVPVAAPSAGGGGDGDGSPSSAAESSTTDSEASEGSSEGSEASEAKPTRRKVQG